VSAQIRTVGGGDPPSAADAADGREGAAIKVVKLRHPIHNISPSSSWSSRWRLCTTRRWAGIQLARGG
jgi:hypothetical protein